MRSASGSVGAPEHGESAGTAADGALDSLPVAVFTARLTGELIAANRRFAELAGFADPAALLGSHVHVLGLSVDALRRAARASTNGRDAGDVPLQLTTKAGERVRVRVAAAELADAGGEVTHLRAVVLPDDRPDRYPDALQHQLVDAAGAIEWQRFVIDAADRAKLGIAISTLADDGSLRLSFLSEGGAAILAAPVESLLGGPAFPHIGAREAARLRENRAQPESATRAADVVEVPRVAPNGDRAILEVGVSQGVYRGAPAMFAIFQDATERRGIEARQRESERLLAGVAGHLPVILFATNADGVVTHCVGSGLRPFGIADEQAVGHRIEEAGWLPDEVRRPLALALAGETVDTQVSVERRNLAIHLAPSLGLDGRPDGVVGLALDVTHTLELESERRAAREGQDTANRMLALARLRSDFINTAAHHLRTPLTPIRMHLFLLRQRLADTLAPEDLNAFEALERNTLRLQELVEEMVRLVALQSGTIVADRLRLDVAAVVSGAIEHQRESALARGVDIRLAESRPSPVDGDPKLLAEAFEGLLRYAVRTTPAGGNVDVSVRPREDAVVIDVRDSGPGLTPSEIANLFEPFGSSPDATTSQQGLVLRIARALIELQGGDVTVSSAGAGQGSVFTLVFPRPNTLPPVAPPTRPAM
ncbi:MAG: sensor histidine kinase [Thermoplasmatota archaeon]